VCGHWCNEGLGNEGQRNERRKDMGGRRTWTWKDMECNDMMWKDMGVEGHGGGRTWRWNDMEVEGHGGGKTWRWKDIEVEGHGGGRTWRWKDMDVKGLHGRFISKSFKS